MDRLKRKIDNDVSFVTTGKDKFWDYGLIEFLRGMLRRTRN